MRKIENKQEVEFKDPTEAEQQAEQQAGLDRWRNKYQGYIRSEKSVAEKQAETVRMLDKVTALLGDIGVFINKHGEPADKEYFSEARQDLNTLCHRLENTPRPRN